MKRYFYLTAAITGLFVAASCQKEDFGHDPGDYADVSFTADIPGVATKAIADGTSVTTLHYEVYTVGANGLPEQEIYDATTPVTAPTTIVNVRLIKNKPYHVFFWAQNDTAPYGVDNLQAISVPYDDASANDESRDAFYAVVKNAKYSTAAAEKVTLVRPFAQVNVATGDIEEVRRHGVPFTDATSTITVTNVATEFAPFTNVAKTAVNAEFKVADVPGEKLLNIGAENKSYDYLAMAYVLVPNASGAVDNTSVSDITATVKTTGMDPDVTVSYEGATLKQNHRTNIIGNLLTTSADYMVEVDNKFTEPDNNHELENVNTPDEANLAFAAGETGVRIETVTEDVTLVLPETTDDVTVILPATDKEVTFDYPASATEHPEVLNITAPEGTTLVLDVPNTTVYVNGVLQTVTAATANNTLVVTDGTIIDNLVVLKGNVKIEKGGKVINISRSADNTDKTTIVALGEGVDKPATTDETGFSFVSFESPTSGTVEEQIAAIAYGKVTLTKDEVLATPLTISAGKEITLDLNGYTLSYTSTAASASNMITVKGNLTIQNGTVTFAATNPDTEWGGEGQPEYPGYANNTVRNEGVLTVVNAILENQTKKGGASYVIDNYKGAKLTINEGSNIIQSGKDIAIRMFNGNEGTIDVTINGGTITGHRAVWIQLASNAPAAAPTMNLTVNGGTLNSVDQTYNHAVYSYTYGNDTRNVNITVSGGIFNGDIAVTGGTNKQSIENVTVYGGTFNGSYGVDSYGDTSKAAEKITIKGGTFSSFYPLTYMGDGEKATFRLKEDIVLTEEESVTIPSGANVTLDLNGKTLSQAKEQTTMHGMIVNRGTLTVKDGAGNGKISYADITAYTQDINYASNTITNHGILNLESGTVENVTEESVMNFSYPHAIDAYPGSTTNIKGGTVKSANYDCIRMFCNSTTSATTVNISGGNIINRVTFQNPDNNRNSAGCGRLVITGGTFTTTEEVNANVRLLNFSNDVSNMKATISGGTFDKGVKTQDHSASWEENWDWLTDAVGVTKVD